MEEYNFCSVITQPFSVLYDAFTLKKKKKKKENVDKDQASVFVFEFHK